jgi:WD40 repeat protein
MENKNKLLAIFLLLVVCLFFSTTTAFSQQSSGQLFEKALYTEEVKGELQNAIDLYQQIVKNNPENRQVAAKSLFQMGMCYEKLGSQEAKKAYQRIIQEFADQKEVVTEAHIRLSRIEQPVYETRIDDMLVRKVLPDTDIDPLGTPSPDGRYISYTDWESGGNLAILDLKTGERRCLTAYESEDEAVYYSSWSPDGKEIAYHWWDESGSRIYIFDLNDDKSRDLLNRKDVEWIELGNWSSDGKHICATFSYNGYPKCQIVKISTENGSHEVLRTFEKTYTKGKPYYSPDSRFIAYNYPVKEDFENNNIFILSLEDNHEFAFFKHPAHDYILGWTPDGKHLLNQLASQNW